MRRAPAFTAFAILTLALAIAVSTTIFSVVYGVLLRPLPLRDPDRIVVIDAWTDQFAGGRMRGSYSLVDADYWRTHARTFEAISLARYESMALATAEGSEPVLASLVTPGFSEAVGPRIAAGRSLAASDDSLPVAFVTSRLARRLFGADERAVGKHVPLNAHDYQIVGVADESFRVFEPRIDLWLTAGYARTLSPQLSNPRAGGFNPVARLKAGVTIAQAQADVASVSNSLGQDKPDPFAHVQATVTPIAERLVGDVRPMLLILLAAVGFVLIVACANVSNLLLTRTISRTRELAIRQSLGASRMRLVRDSLAESAVLAGSGAILGTALASWLTAALVERAPTGLTKLDAIRVDLPVLLFAVGLTALTVVAVGVLPAFHTLDSSEILRAGTATGAPRARRWRSALVVVELALSIALLVGASLFGRSFVRLTATDIGMATDHLAQGLVVLSLGRTLPDERRIALVDRIVERLSMLPGVEVAGVSASLPPNRPRSRVSFTAVDPISGQPANYLLDSVSTTPGFFAASRLPLLKGRWLAASDRANASPVMLVSAAVAKRFFGDRDPIGLTLPLGAGTPDGRRPNVTVVGVVGDVKYNGIDATGNGAIYRPYAQSPTPSVFVVARTRDDPKPFAATLRRELGTIDPSMAIYSVGTVDGLVADAVAQPRLRTTTLVALATLALLLAGVGVYGIVSYSVSQRTSEIGVRMALGARASDVVAMVMHEGLVLALIGGTIGLAASLALARTLSSLLYGVASTDVFSFVASAAILTLVTAMATYAPARRAARVDPVVSLRDH